MASTNRRTPLVIALAVIVLAVAWIAFRPELLFVNKHVDDPFPAVATSAPARL